MHRRGVPRGTSRRSAGGIAKRHRHPVSECFVLTGGERPVSVKGRLGVRRYRTERDEVEMRRGSIAILILFLGLTALGIGRNALSGADGKPDKAPAPSYSDDIR